MLKVTEYLGRRAFNHWIVAVSFLAVPMVNANSPTSASTLTEAQEQAWQALNIKAVESSVIPKYAALADQASQLVLSTEQFCAKVNTKNLKDAQQAYHATMDQWQGIQHIRFGPIETLMRNYSMQFWPDKKNHVGKRLNQLIASQDNAKLEGKAFYSVPVSIRGLPAVERILFAPDAIKAIQVDPYRCKVALRISRYIEEMATGIETEWRRDMLPSLQEVGGEESLFENQQDVALAFLKPVLEQIEVIRDLKLSRPMASTIEKAKFKRLESWRSQRSFNNIEINIAALEQAVFSNPIYQVQLSESERSHIQQQFTQLKAQLGVITPPLENAIRDPEGYQQLAKVTATLAALHKSLESTLAAHDLFLGFNSRDGD